MAPRYRSRRARLAALSAQFRAKGRSWAEIARIIGDQEHVNARVALRLAHGWTQEQVAARWNEQWLPKGGGAGITDKNISYWETWPQSGVEPSLKTLKRLALLYQCDVGQLVEDGDYRYLDEVHGEGDRDVEHLHAPVARAVIARSAAAFTPASDQTVASRDSRLPCERFQVTATLGSQIDERSADVLAPLQLFARLARQPAATAREREVLYEELVRFLASWAGQMNRRDLLHILGWAATAAATMPVFSGLNLDEQARVVQVLDAPQRVDETVIGHIEAVLWSAMRQDDSLGPQAALDTVLAQRNLTRAVLPECPQSLRARLLSLFSNLSRFAGWLSFDLGDFDGAAYYYEQARIAAHEAEDTELGAFVLCNMSHLATWRGQPRVGIDHAVAAQGWARDVEDPLLRAYAADVAARAYAAAGRQQDCLGTLSGIPDVMSTSGRRAGNSLVYFYGPGVYAGTQAECLILLGDAHSAAEAARRALRLVDPSFVRNQAFCTLDLANAYRESKEIEEAARLIGVGAELAVRNRSPRLIEQVHQCRQRLEAWRHTPAVKTLDERLASYGWGRSSIT